jgi:hypothetical protein
MPYALPCVFRILLAIGLLHGIACAAQPVQLPRTEISGKLVHDPAWMSYRDARRVVEMFERYAKPKDLVRLLYSLEPKWPESFRYDGLTFAVEDDEHVVPLPLRFGYADMLLHPPVNERQARFVVNRPRGTLTLDYNISVAPRADQHYEQPYQRKGCAQAFDLYRTQTTLTELSTAGKQCVGLQFFLLSDDSIVVQRDIDGEERELPAQRGRFGRRVDVRWSEQLQSIDIRPPDRPHVIGVLFE